MPVIFTFGVPNLFSFTFRAGPTLPGLLNGTVHDESSPSVTNDCEASKKVNTIAPVPSYGRGKTVSSPCGTLSKLPLEIRIMIYRNVLKYKSHIDQPHMFLGLHLPILAEGGRHFEAIDSALLRTCKAIYCEAILILYGTNGFRFLKPSDIKEFAHAGLGSTPFGFYRNNTTRKPSSAVQNALYGRLTMIRRINLKLKPEHKGDDLQKIWSYWSDFFYPPEEQDQLIAFPDLKFLVLDFTDWKLKHGNSSKIRVTPFLRRLRPTGGVKYLNLIGVLHEQNLRDFKHGLVREGGTFHSARPSDKSVAKIIVTHDDLPEVSMFVRAIVEKDKALRTIL